MIESKGYKITPIDGDLAVGRNAEIGRDVDIHGKARVAGSLKVEGFLDAPHIKGAAKGLFNSVEELTKEYPNPRPGWFAIVLDATNKEKGILYKAENRGWVATTDEAKPFEFIADSINVFASKGELADETQRAQGAENILTQRIVNETGRAIEAENEIKKNAVKFSRIGIIGYADKLELMAATIVGAEVRYIDIPGATETKAGVVSAEDKKKFVKPITWNNDTAPSNMNDFVAAGVYDIKGEHKREDDNLPVLNTGGGHSFNARLTVLDSSISGSGEDDDKCITQVLSFSNRLGQGEVYIRTGKGSSLDNLTWEKWSTLQRNVNVDTVTSLDHLIDNGIYSGVLAPTRETFLLVVINNYAFASQKGIPKSISQFKYSVSLGESFAKYETRVGTGVNAWSDWVILNKDEINSMITKASRELTDYINSTVADAKRDILEGIDPKKIDSIKDIVAWIDAHGDVTAIYNAIQQNTVNINAEVNRAERAEAYLGEAISLNFQALSANKANKSEAMQYNTLGVSVYPDKAEIYGRSIDGKPRTFDFPAATTEKAGVMSAGDKKQLYSTAPHTLIYNSSFLSNGYVDGNADTYTEVASSSLKYMTLAVQEGLKCTLTSVRRNLGHMYIIYNANDEKIANFAGTNATVLTQEFTIPKDGVKLAVNCDAAYIDNFSLSIVGNPTLLSRVVSLETESVNIDRRITEIDSKIFDVEKQVASTEQNIFNYNSSSLSKGYVDGSKSELTVNTSLSYISHLIVDVAFGNVCKLNTARYNNGYNYIIYNSNNEMIAYHKGENYVLENLEFTIPNGGVKLAVNCDTAKIDGFSLSIVGIPTLLSRVIELEKENVEFDVLSAKNRIVYTLGSSTIDLMKTANNADGVKDWTYLAQLLGAKKLYNIAIGGSTWQTQGIDTDTPDINITATRSASNQIKMLKRLVDSGKYEYPEIIFLQFTNGYSVSGTITDNMEQVMAMSFDELEANANIRLGFYGGVRYALELLNRYFPKATYYVSDGIQCDRDLPYRRGYEYVKSGREALKKMCDRYSCPFLETSRSIGIVDLYEHGSKTSTSNIEIFTGATATGTIVLSLKDNDIDVSVTAGDTANVVAQKIANAVNSSNIGWAATLNGSKVLLSVAKESAAVPEFNAVSTGVSVDITFNQFADDYDGIYLSTDGLHPNEKGKQLIARCVAKGILGTYFEKQ